MLNIFMDISWHSIQSQCWTCLFGQPNNENVIRAKQSACESGQHLKSWNEIRSTNGILRWPDIFIKTIAQMIVWLTRTNTQPNKRKNADWFVFEVREYLWQLSVAVVFILSESFHFSMIIIIHHMRTLLHFVMELLVCVVNNRNEWNSVCLPPPFHFVPSHPR